MKIAISQNFIGGGGRLAVILEMIYVLNESGFVPDILTHNFNLTMDEVQKKYKRKLNFNIRIVRPNLFSKLPELNIVLFNFWLRFYIREYDLIIDSNNTTCLLPDNKTILSYVYYPRIDRVLRKKSIHLEDLDTGTVRTRIVESIDRALALLFYRNHRINNNTHIVTLSQFSREAILRRYELHRDNIKIIYPPVDISAFYAADRKKNSVVTIGRFSVAKRQLEQIKIAELVPELTFYIAGFAAEGDPYLKQCESYIRDHGIKNVILYPSVDFDTMLKLLSEAKFFLHTLKNEPFGITTVQGIAAGCLPVVPNSGGQIEVVPPSELRFDGLQHAADIMNTLRDKNCSDTVSELTDHNKIFSCERFHADFKETLNSLLM